MIHTYDWISENGEYFNNPVTNYAKIVKVREV